jgi:hypothetical protein
MKIILYFVHLLIKVKCVFVCLVQLLMSDFCQINKEKSKNWTQKIIKLNDSRITFFVTDKQFTQ